MKATRKGLGGILAASIMVGSLTTAASAAPPLCVKEEASLESFELGIDAARRSYRTGQVARLAISVTRPVEVAGQRAAEEPVEGADAFVIVKIGQRVLAAGGTTGAEGVAKVSIRLKRWITSGWADVFVLARKQYADAPCLRASEYGTATADRLFRVRG